MDLSIIENPWFIAAAALFAAEVGVPFVSFLVRKIRAQFGVFSGQYVALTGDSESNSVLIEYVECKNIQEQVVGSIKGIAVVPMATVEQSATLVENSAQYKFRGRVHERIFSISYESKSRRENSIGMLILKGDETGTVFAGQWAGSAGDSLMSAKCTWIRLDSQISSALPPAEFVSAAVKELSSVEIALANSLKRALASANSKDIPQAILATSMGRKHLLEVLPAIRIALSDSNERG